MPVALLEHAGAALSRSAGSAGPRLLLGRRGTGADGAGPGARGQEARQGDEERERPVQPLVAARDHGVRAPAGHIDEAGPGGEFAGVVEECGAAVTRVRPGDRVKCDSVWGCGSCTWCQRGATQFCTQGSEFGITFVIIPNPCRLLSRELLYTALTRQRNKIIILHQGSLHEIKAFSQDYYSESAARLTNLFNAPQPVFVQERFLENAR